MKKFLSLLLALSLCLCTVSGALAANADEAVDTVSKSKTATNLNEQLETTVTLSFPSEEVSLDSDVVFVLDKSTSAAVEAAALKMLQNLQEQLKGTSAKIKVGVVIFNKEANNVSNGLLDLATQYATIKAAIETDISSGTNTHAGLLVGKRLLDSDTSVDASRKHLIFVSDGISYIFNEYPTTVGVEHYNDHMLFAHGQPNNESWKFKYGNNDAPADWDKWMTEIGQLVVSQGNIYDHSYVSDGSSYEPGEHYWDPLLPLDDLNAKGNKNYVVGNEKALYLTAQVYRECEAAGYNCYAMVPEQKSGTEYLWGPSFMNYLAGGKTLDFTKIEAEILYMLGKGSTVVDVIGDKFDLIPGSFQLTVGGNTYPVTHNGNHYTFGSDKQYQVEYNPAGESFTFTIGENVTNFQRVQLSYKLKVANPETAPGTYGQYDRDGSKGYDGLYTNEKAELTPVDSNGKQGEKETFQKPTVSYTVNGTTPAEPTTPDVPKTGDASTPALWLALCALSAAAFLALSRRRAA